MKIFISSAITTNSFGKPISSTPEGIANFWKWFGDSKAVDSQGRPVVVYHGSKSDISSVDTLKYGVGKDEYGSGFYTTTEKHTASGYAEGDGDGGNVIPLYVRILKPVNVNKALTRLQIHKLIISSPDFNESIQNFGDVSFEGYVKVLDSAIDQYVDMEGLYCLNMIATDFWKGNEGKFLEAANKITKYDGVINKFENGETFYVSWLPNQIKSVYNNGKFGKTHSITASGE